MSKKKKLSLLGKQTPTSRRRRGLWASIKKKIEKNVGGRA